MFLLLAASLPLLSAQDPLSYFYSVDQFRDRTIQLNFTSPCRIYVASTETRDSLEAERSIYIYDGNSKIAISDAAQSKDKEGYLKPIYDWPVSSVSVHRSYPEKTYLNPAVIYVVDYTQIVKVMSVPKDPVMIELESPLTILSPRGTVRLDGFGDAFTPMIISAGGLEEARNKDFTLHNIGSSLDYSNPPIFLFEPLITLKKEYQEAVNGHMNVSGNEELPSEMDLKVKQGDRLAAMSKGYKLSSTSVSMSYRFHSAGNDSQFSVRLFGDIPESSQLMFQSDHSKAETLKGKRGLVDHALTFEGDSLTISYSRGSNDNSTGYFAYIKVQSTSSSLLLAPIIMLLLFYYLK